MADHGPDVGRDLRVLHLVGAGHEAAEQVVHGTATLWSFMSCSTLASSFTGRAAASRRLLECTAVLPQHTQPGILLQAQVECGGRRLEALVELTGGAVSEQPG